MKTSDLAVMVRGVAPILRESIALQTAGMWERIGEMEKRVSSLRDGKDGVDGKDGDKGLDGRDGIDGVHGKDGRDGVDGQHGHDGKDGKDGEIGQKGADGGTGLDGKDGRDGKDFTRELDDLDQADLTTHADVLMRKAFADLDAAAPRRIDRVPVRDARGKILRVVEVEAKG